MKRLCTIDGCGRELSSRATGLCLMHQRRFKRNGDPLVKRRARGVMDAPVIRYRSFITKEERAARRKNARYRTSLRLVRVMVILLRARGEIVTRERLCELARIPEKSLSVAIHDLRYTLSRDNYDGYDAIRTWKGEGYSADMDLLVTHWRALRQERINYWHGLKEKGR